MVMTSVARLLNRHFKLVTFSFFLGFGLTGCSGGDEPDEPLQTEAEEASGHDGAAPDEAAAPDETAAASAGEQPVASSDEVPASEDEPKAEEASNEEAPPPAVMDESSETVKAELSNDSQPVASEPAVSVASDTTQNEPGTPDALSNALEPEPSLATAEPAPANNSDDGKSISSPGAAKFIKGTHDKHHGKKAHHHSSSNTASTGGNSDGAYVVQPGDTLAMISEKIYGSAKIWHGLAELNGISPPYRIYPGDEVKFDSSNKKAASFAKHMHAGMRTVTVKKGDTLSSLAEQVFGSAFAWKLFLSYNKQKISNPNVITTGMKLSYLESGASKSADGAPTPKTPKHKTASAGKNHHKVKKAPISQEALSE